MEALASATPVVATDVGGVTELVQDKKTGFVVSPRDPSCLAQAMEELMNVPDDRRAAMGREGREWIRAKCSVDEVVDQWLALYNDVLANSW
jgi:glycosyltransferase involved in cell wall biosynthesis